LGIRIDKAPQISEEHFVGRENELEQLHTWLTPRPQRQNVVVLCGLGGMGKTQLSVQYAQRFGDRYSSVFWLNAKDEGTLKAGMVEMATQVTEDAVSANMTDAHEEERMVRQAREWLSRRGNESWLLVYDNYDDPRLPGIDSLTGYDIRDFFPKRAQGSILITTRSRRLTFTKQLRLQKLDDVDQSLIILATRSGRKIEGGEASCLCRRMIALTD
jgi:NB-ARC domain